MRCTAKWPADVKHRGNNTAPRGCKVQRRCPLHQRLVLPFVITDTPHAMTGSGCSRPAGTGTRGLQLAPRATARAALLRIHDLRHTAAALLLLQGVPVKMVSEMLGHASVTITMNLYLHVLPSMQRAAAEAMEAMFARGLQPTLQPTGEN